MTVPFPGTELFKELKSKQLLRSYNWQDYGFGKSVIKTAVSQDMLQEVFKGFWVKTYSRPKALLKQVRFFLSGNRFRRAMAKQYVKMSIEMISDVKKMSDGKGMAL